MRKLHTLFLVMAVMSAPLSAETFHYFFSLNGAQEVPSNGSTATGLGDVMLNTDTNALSWNIQFTPFDTPVTAAHFHAPAAPGVNAPVVLGIATAGATSPIVGNATISDTFENQLLGGISYVNVHTQAIPTGEIRGQVTPEPATMSLLALGGLALLRRRR